MKNVILKKIIFLLITFGYSVTLFAALDLNNNITWDVIGLDSNSPLTDGPNQFPVGVRVCNTGGTTETNVTANFVWDDAVSFDWDTQSNTKTTVSTGTYVNLSSASTYTVDEILPGECQDFYFQVEVTRDPAAFDTVREYHIEVSSDTTATQSTTIGNQLYVERLISQNRNSNIDIVLDSDPTADPVTVYVGEVITFTATADTATNGYEQIEAYFGFNPDIFRIVSIDTNYSAGGNFSTLYSDGCTWDETPANSGTYKSCLGTGKAGGALSVTYTVEIIESGSGVLGGLVYDFSGSSYHYNSDFGDFAESLTYTAAYKSELSVTKTDNKTTTFAGDTITYDIVVLNSGPSPLIGGSVSDTIPTNLENVTWTCTTDPDTLASFSETDCITLSGTGDINTTVNIDGGESIIYTVTGTVIASPTSNELSNTVTITPPASYDPEDNTADNTATDITDIPLANLVVSKDDGALTYTPGDSGVYTIIVTNLGPDSVVGAVLTDNLPAGVTLSGPVTCVATGSASCTASTGVATDTSFTDTAIDITADATGTVNFVTYSVPVTFSNDMTAY